MKPNLRTRLRRPSGWLLLLVLIVWSVLISLGLSLAIGSENLAIAAHKSIDVIPEKTELGQQTYLSSCATCHVPIPPQLLPTQRWAEILERPDQHFGVNLRNAESRGQGIPPVTNIDIYLIWDYVQQVSRVYREEEDLPSRLNNSRFFWALHPKIGATCQQNDIDCPDRISVQTCNTCHTAARRFDYRQLTPEWDNSL